MSWTLLRRQYQVEAPGDSTTGARTTLEWERERAVFLAGSPRLRPSRSRVATPLVRLIFESDTPPGRRFDVALLAAIVASVVVVMLETVQPLADRHADAVPGAGVGIHAALQRGVHCAPGLRGATTRYATSFFGLVDLASVLPMYLATVVPGLHVLIDIRILRMLRAFRILKLTEYVREYSSLGEALYASRRKIAVFLRSSPWWSSCWGR